MPKKKSSHRSSSPRRPTPSRRLVEKIQEAIDLLSEGDPDEALEILEELDRAYPNTPEVVGNLVNAYFDLQDLSRYEGAIRRLARLDPRDADIQFSMAGAYMVNLRPAMAMRAFQDALRRWPAHPHADDARAELPKLELILGQEAGEMDMSLDQAMDLLLQHDELRYCLAHSEFHQGLQVAEKLLRAYPRFVPALNNLSQIYAFDGELEPAIQTALRVLEIEPENVHALSNLARLHFLSGRPEEAQRFAERLKGSTADAADRWTKIAEALTFLEDDQGVLDLYSRAKSAGQSEPPAVDAIFYHLLAAAAAHAGKPRDARKYWQKSLKINPNFAWPRENLDDLDLPAGQRAGPWAYATENWLLTPVMKDLLQHFQKLQRAADKSRVQSDLSRLFEEKYPRVFFLAPHMLARGDPQTREVVARLAALTAHPGLVEAAKSFIFGQRGTFDERFEAAHSLSEAGLLPSGPLRMWSGGEWSEMLLLDIEISPEARPTHRSRQVDQLAREAYQALRDRDAPRAIPLLEKAIAQAPEEPIFHNNLAMAYQMRGELEKSEQIRKDILVRFPDYFFGILGAAGEAMEARDFERARGLLTGLMQRKQLHQSEFAALCRAQIQLGLAEGKPGQVRSWLEMWERVDPQNPDLDTFRGLAKRIS